MTRLPVPGIPIREDSWISRDDSDDVLTLDGGIVLFGCQLHVEAHAVKDVGQLQVEDGSDFEKLHGVFACHGPVQTVTIRGREYAIFALPYSA